MAGICTASTRVGGPQCDHRTVTIDLDGEPIIINLTEIDLDTLAWDEDAKRLFVTLGLKRRRMNGLALDDAVGHVTNGDEGTNVKQFVLLAKDVTKNNIGITYVDVPPGLNGERGWVEFTGCTEFRVVVNVNFVGSGPMRCRVIRDTDNAVLWESAPILVPSGEKEVESGWLPLPGGQNPGLVPFRFQARSQTAADSPIYRRCMVLVR